MTIQLRAELQLADIGQVVPGTTLEDQYGRKATVLDNGYATLHEGGASYPLYNMRNWRYSHIPDRPLPRYTIDVFKQMARTVCHGFAIQHGVAIQPVLTALERIGASDGNPPLGVGMYVHYSDGDLRARLGRKRGVVYGHGNPNQWEAYGEFRDMDGSRPTMGGVTYFSSNMRVMAMDDPDTDRWLREPTEEDDAEVARMRGVMWEIGVRAKRANSWCEAYETAMSVLGITSHTPTEVTARQPEVAGLGHPDAVTKPVDNLPTVHSANDVDQYPVGAVFEYVGQPQDLTRSPDYTDPNTQWCWHIRTDRDGGMEQTENFIGPNGGRWGGDRRVLWNGEGQMSIPIYRDLMPHLPVGTVVSHRSGGTYFYKKVVHSPGDMEWATCDAGGTNAGTASARNEGFIDGRGNSPWVICMLPGTRRHGANNAHPAGR